MSRLFVIGFTVVALLASAPAAPHGYDKGDIRLRHPWARATPPGATVGAGYLEIRNNGKTADRLVGAVSPVAERVELHVTSHEGDVMKMREAPTLEVPARQRFTLRAGGPHLMLVGLKKPLAKGDRVPLTLRFERAGEIQVELEVQAADSRKPHH
jgi:copper(I)-binding protein